MDTLLIPCFNSRFDLQQQTLLNDQISPEAHAQVTSTVLHGNVTLTLYSDRHALKLKKKCHLIN